MPEPGAGPPTPNGIDTATSYGEKFVELIDPYNCSSRNILRRNLSADERTEIKNAGVI